jgi:hypothetical protein
MGSFLLNAKTDMKKFNFTNAAKYGIIWHAVEKHHIMWLNCSCNGIFCKKKGCT